ncbi:hypothetical protein E1181_16075 [Saccharopolyspora terrae]|uniref:Uncharacterized protein n=1 Tax=Saccharopolyspora terrae TaxID=2530384 RepID=A0A4R4VH91_9PSEU|nr:hypothetical protein [Saccharopolyspora terrae]TDD05008.1 hypothetical protein E1181_16075 [Saccharopolyspora terrae]
MAVDDTWAWLADGAYASEAVGKRPFDAVQCHDVIGQLDDLETGGQPALPVRRTRWPGVNHDWQRRGDGRASRLASFDTTRDRCARAAPRRQRRGDQRPTTVVGAIASREGGPFAFPGDLADRW